MDISRSFDKIAIGVNRLDHNYRGRLEWLDLCDGLSPSPDEEEDTHKEKDEDGDTSNDPANDCALHERVRFRALVGFLIVKFFCLLAILFSRVS
jgi:hypothetical protein